jgi:hypothetical protein
VCSPVDAERQDEEPPVSLVRRQLQVHALPSEPRTVDVQPDTLSIAMGNALVQRLKPEVENALADERPIPARRAKMARYAHRYLEPALCERRRHSIQRVVRSAQYVAILAGHTSPLSWCERGSRT